jgi:phosphoribosylglycinamide formyltransferase-1
VLAQEHIIYPRALRRVCTGEARLEDGRVVFKAGWSGADALRSPP